MTAKRKRRNFTDEFKQQVVQLYESGKPRAEIIREYDLPPSAIGLDNTKIQDHFLTYVRVGETWHYICVLLDLFNREIIGHSSGPNKTSTLVQRAFASVPYNLYSISLFHTDRVKKFDNRLIEQALEAFGIE